MAALGASTVIYTSRLSCRENLDRRVEPFTYTGTGTLTAGTLNVCISPPGNFEFKHSESVITLTVAGESDPNFTLGWAAYRNADGVYVASSAAGLGTRVKATTTITSDATAPADGSTVTIGNKVYTFKTALTPTEGQVLINTTAEAALLNLKRAIDHTGTPDTDYKCAAAHTQVYGGAAAATTLVLYALAAGTAGNVALAQAGTSHVTFTAATMTGGANTCGSTATEATTEKRFDAPQGAAIILTTINSIASADVIAGSISFKK